MQHHGAPTPLLDWTKSPYVAAYFACEEEPQGSEKRSAIWAIDLHWIQVRTRELLQLDKMSEPVDSGTVTKAANALLSQDEKESAAVIAVDPLNLDGRMSAQQGVFLCRTWALASFSQSLMRMMIHPTLTKRPLVRKLELDGTCRKQFLGQLRSMNIHRASLFPGLDGLAKSLGIDLELKDQQGSRQPIKHS